MFKHTIVCSLIQTSEFLGEINEPNTQITRIYKPKFQKPKILFQKPKILFQKPKILLQSLTFYYET